METKICNKCGIEKPLSCFYFRKDCNGYRGTCKDCMKKSNSISAKKYRESHVDELKQRRKELRIEKINSETKEEREIRLKKRNEYYAKNKEKFKMYHKRTYDKNKEKNKERNKKWREKNKDIIKNKKHEYYIRNKEKIREKNKKYDEEHREHLLEIKRIKGKEYYLKNKNKIIKRAKIQAKERYKSDDLYRLKKIVRSRIKTAFNRKGLCKSKSTKYIIGCDYDFLYNYLLETYKNNYNYEWDETISVEIDHIIPLSIAQNEEELLKLCHYTNLQLLKKEDNQEKSNKLDWKINNE